MQHHTTSQSGSGVEVVSEAQYDVTIGMFWVRCHSAGNVAEGRWSAKNGSGREVGSWDLGYKGSGVLRKGNGVAEVLRKRNRVAEAEVEVEKLVWKT